MQLAGTRSGDSCPEGLVAGCASRRVSRENLAHRERFLRKSTDIQIFHVLVWPQGNTPFARNVHFSIPGQVLVQLAGHRSGLDPDPISQTVDVGEVGSDQPSERDRIDFFNCLDVYHRSPNSGERRYKSRT